MPWNQLLNKTRVGTTTPAYRTDRSDDDGFFGTNNDYDVSDSYGVYVRWTGNPSAWQEGFFRIRGIDVPQGSTIISAVFIPTSHVVSSEPDLLMVRISCEDADNAEPYVGPIKADDAFSRPITSARLYHKLDQRTDDVYEIKSLVQEVINRSGWESGNAICIRMRPWSYGVGVSNSFKGHRIYPSSDRATLQISYI